MTNLNKPDVRIFEKIICGCKISDVKYNSICVSNQFFNRTTNFSLPFVLQKDILISTIVYCYMDLPMISKILNLTAKSPNSAIKQEKCLTVVLQT